LNGGQNVTFRIYAYGGASTKITSMRIDDFTVTGTSLPIELGIFRPIKKIIRYNSAGKPTMKHPTLILSLSEVLMASNSGRLAALQESGTYVMQYQEGRKTIVLGRFIKQ